VAPDLVSPPAKGKLGATMKPGATQKLGATQKVPPGVGGAAASNLANNHPTMSQLKQILVAQLLMPLGSDYIRSKYVSIFPPKAPREIYHRLLPGRFTPGVQRIAVAGQIYPGSEGARSSTP
jgi:hypothetical protein